MDALILNKLIRYCTYCERCTQDAVKKLMALKVDKSEHQQYLKNLHENRFVDDVRYAKMYVHTYTQIKKQGKAKVQNALMRKGISSSVIKELLKDVPDEGYQQNIELLAERKLKSIRKGTDREKQMKVLRFLIGRGYSMTDARNAIAAVK